MACKIKKNLETKLTLQVVPAVGLGSPKVGAVMPSSAKHFGVVEPELHVAALAVVVPHLHVPSSVSHILTSLRSVATLVRHDPASHFKYKNKSGVKILFT